MRGPGLVEPLLYGGHGGQALRNMLVVGGGAALVWAAGQNEVNQLRI